MGKARSDTYDKIKELIPQFLAAGKIKTKNEYRYYKVEKDKTMEGDYHAIYLLTAKEEEAEYLPRLKVIDTSPQEEVKAVCPHVAVEHETGEHYLFYGKDKGGIYALHLNPRNGLAHIEGYGICVARRPKWLGEAISQPYVVYNEKTQYYYLFVTYGDPNSDANIRVGRSKKITGPYLDPMNRSLRDIDDFKAAHGFMISAGYRYDDTAGIKAPSSPMVYQNENGQWFFLQEITPYQSSKNELLDNQESRVLDLRELFWTSDGWPVLSPVTYHKVDKDEISPKDLMGNYEFIKLTPMLPQGVFNSVTLSILDHSMQGVSSTRNSWAWKIPQTAQGRLELGGSIRGYWRLLDMDVIEFNYENYIETYQISMAWDPDLDQRLIILTGKDSNGLACFAKKVYQS